MSRNIHRKIPDLENSENSRILIKKPESEFVYNKVLPTQVFSCEYCKIFKNTYFEEHLRTAASECRLQQQ